MVKNNRQVTYVNKRFSANYFTTSFLVNLLMAEVADYNPNVSIIYEESESSSSYVAAASDTGDTDAVNPDSNGTDKFCPDSRGELVKHSTYQCQKFATESPSYDVPVQKSRLRSKESVSSRKDDDVCMCTPRQGFVEGHYKMTKSLLKNLKSVADGQNLREDFLEESHDGSSNFFTASSMFSCKFLRFYPKDGESNDSSRFSRRQGTGRRTRANEAILRPKTKKTPGTLTYLCLRVIDENVMRCEKIFEIV